MAKRSNRKGKTSLAKILDEDLEPDKPPGTVLIEYEVPGRAVPWKAPRNSRGGGVVPSRDYKKYKDWKQCVAEHAKLAAHRKPYGGRVMLRARFYMDSRYKNGTGHPDLTNLIKAVEDSMNGLVYRDDAQVLKHDTELIINSNEPQRVEIEVVAY